MGINMTLEKTEKNMIQLKIYVGHLEAIAQITKYFIWIIILKKYCLYINRFMICSITEAQFIKTHLIWQQVSIWFVSIDTCIFAMARPSGCLMENISRYDLWWASYFWRTPWFIPDGVSRWGYVSRHVNLITQWQNGIWWLWCHGMPQT